jgi:hypothetical protein
MPETGGDLNRLNGKFDKSVMMVRIGFAGRTCVSSCGYPQKMFL